MGYPWHTLCEKVRDTAMANSHVLYNEHSLLLFRSQLQSICEASCKLVKLHEIYEDYLRLFEIL